MIKPIVVGRFERVAMRILLVGASGTLGTAVRSALADRHELITASRSGADERVDITDPESVARLYAVVGTVDAVACAAGSVTLTALARLSREDLEAGIRHKLLGQVELVRLGQAHVRPGGSFTLITSVLSDDPVPGSAAAALVSGGLKAFVRAAAIELPAGLRINAVSPSVFTTSLPSALFPGAVGVAPARVARAYVKSIEGAQTGQIYRVEEQF